MRKLRLPIVTITLLSLFLAACGGGATPAAPPTPTEAPAAATEAQAGQAMELNFWGGWTGPDRDVMAKMVDEYNASQSKIHVTLTTQQWTPLFEKFVVSVRSKSVPDILAMHGPDIPQFAAQGVLEPLDKVVSQAGFKEGDFAKPAWDGTIYNQTQYAFPLDLHMHAVYYNADMFAKANLTPPSDWVTKDDFLKMATALTFDKNGKHPGEDGFDANNVQQYGFAMYTNHHAFFTFYALLNQQGDNFLNADNTKVDYPAADGLKAWQWLQDLVFKYNVVPAGETSPLQDFLSGKTAMLADGPWQIPAMQAQSGLKWGTFPMPQVFAKPAAWGSSGNIPALNSARESTDFTSLPGRTGFVKSLPYEVMLPAIPAEAQVFSSAATSPIVVASQQIVIEDKPIEPAMQTMNQSVDSILASSQ
jgi:multiple sugar transport system substrate-binding protein